MTPEMIEAGATALWRKELPSHEDDMLSVVAAVYRTMEKARRESDFAASTPPLAAV